MVRKFETPARVLLLVAALVMLAAAAGTQANAQSADVKIAITGTIATGVTGGTGTTVTAGGTAYDLDLGGKDRLVKTATSLNGKTALVTGFLVVQSGPDGKPQRLIITVRGIKAK